MQNENINDDRFTKAVPIFTQMIALMSALDSAIDLQEISVEFEFDPGAEVCDEIGDVSYVPNCRRLAIGPPIQEDAVCPFLPPRFVDADVGNRNGEE